MTRRQGRRTIPRRPPDPRTRTPHTTTSPRESERPIYREDGLPDQPETESRSFLALLAESITLTLQGAAETLSRDLPWDIADRRAADARLGALQRLIEDRRLILAAYDEGRTLPRGVLVRHGWLAVTEARLNVRDAPDSWSSERAVSTADAAEEGAVWLRNLGIIGPRSAASLDDHGEH